MSKQSKQTLIVILCLFFVAVTVGFFIRQNKLKIFKERGIETVATIIDIKRGREFNTSGEKRNKYYIEITYFTQKSDKEEEKANKYIEKDENEEYQMNFDNLKPEIGEYVKTKIYISSSEVDKYRINDKIQILYLSDDIEKAILKSDLE